MKIFRFQSLIARMASIPKVSAHPSWFRIGVNVLEQSKHSFRLFPRVLYLASLINSHFHGLIPRIISINELDRLFCRKLLVHQNYLVYKPQRPVTCLIISLHFQLRSWLKKLQVYTQQVVIVIKNVYCLGGFMR